MIPFKIINITITTRDGLYLAASREEEVGPCVGIQKILKELISKSNSPTKAPLEFAWFSGREASQPRRQVAKSGCK